MYKSLMLFLLLLVGCDSNPIYRGDKVELDFSSVRTIQDGDWIEINGSRYTHYSEYTLAEQDSYSLFASQMKYAIQENNMYEPINPYTIGVLLASHIDWNNSKGDSTYVVDDSLRYMVHIAGRLVLKTNNKKPVTVRTRKGYPVVINIVD